MKLQSLDNIKNRDALLAFIASNFYRFIQNPDSKDDKSMLLLIAAITLLNASDSEQTENVAKRLAQLALSRTAKRTPNNK